MLELLGTVLTGGATGIIGSILGKAFGFLEYWVEEKKKDNDHQRTLEMLEMQGKLRAEDRENEQRIASYTHDTGIGMGSQWVIDLIRLVRPCLTFLLIIIVFVIYFSDPVGRDTIEASVIFMASTATLWWFGERAMRKK
ncbi:hypothetical protein [uncultured Mediterranean phage]|nr:hypothetical protein [uncultured Mediterranean phage]